MILCALLSNLLCIAMTRLWPDSSLNYLVSPCNVKVTQRVTAHQTNQKRNNKLGLKIFGLS